MESTWHHPHLGTFTRNKGCYWHGLVDAPAFDAFAHVSRYPNDPPPNGKYELLLTGPKDAPAPLPEAVVLAERLVANQVALVPAITAALWEDFNGRGHESGMWWHDNLAEVETAVGAKLSGPEDLLPLLRLDDIAALDANELPGCDAPVLYLDFRATFEEEHGLAMLTDGTRILGAGYQGEVTPYGYTFE